MMKYTINDNNESSFLSILETRNKIKCIYHSLISDLILYDSSSPAWYMTYIQYQPMQRLLM